MHHSVSFNFFQIEKGWWGGAHIEIDLDRNRGLELQQAWSNDEVGWSAGVGLFGQLAMYYLLHITKVELGGAVTYEYNMSKTQADCTMLLRGVMVVELGHHVELQAIYDLFRYVGNLWHYFSYDQYIHALVIKKNIYM